MIRLGIKKVYGIRRKLRDTIFYYISGGISFHKPPIPLDPSLLQTLPIRSRPEKNERHICFCIGSLGPGGAERQMTNLACELAQRGHHITVIADQITDTNGHYLPQLQAAGIAVMSPTRFMSILGMNAARKRTIPAFPAASALIDMRSAIFALAHILANNTPDIVHCYLDSSNTSVPLAAFMAGVPAIRLSARSLAPIHYLNMQQDWLMATRDIYRRLLETDRVSMEANSHAGKHDYAEWLSIAPEKIDVVPNGITENSFSLASEKEVAVLRTSLGLEPGTPTVACVLRMTEEKCPLSIIEVAARVCKRYPKTQFLFAGDGPMRPEVVACIKQYGLNKNVVLLGRRDDVPVLIAAANMLLLTSRIEGLPNVIMEAMFAGKPVIASSVGGVPDLIEQDKHGLLYYKDDFEGMANGICHLLNTPSEARAMGKASIDKIKKAFTLKDLADRMETQYSIMLNNTK